MSDSTESEEDPYVVAALQALPSPDYVPGFEEPEQAPPSTDYRMLRIEEVEEPPSSANRSCSLPAADQAPSAEETKPFETDESAATPPPHPEYRVTARIFIPAPSTHPLQYITLYQFITSACVIAITTPRPLLFIRLSSHYDQACELRNILLPFLPLQPFILSPTKSDAPFNHGIPTTFAYCQFLLHHHTLYYLSSRRGDITRVTYHSGGLGIARGPRYEVGESSSATAARPARGLRADYDFVATMDREIRRDPERDVGYGITNSWDETVKTLQGAPVSTDTELGRHTVAFKTWVRKELGLASEMMKAKTIGDCRDERFKEQLFVLTSSLIRL
ncbi:hypothetical protein Tco_0198823 [Tanacetum coccineum]